MRAKNRTEISEFVESRMGTYQGVRDVNITMTMETYKEEFLTIQRIENPEADEKD